MNNFLANEPLGINSKARSPRLIFLEFFNVRITSRLPQFYALVEFGGYSSIKYIYLLDKFEI